MYGINLKVGKIFIKFISLYNVYQKFSKILSPQQKNIKTINKTFILEGLFECTFGCGKKEDKDQFLGFIFW